MRLHNISFKRVVLRLEKHLHRAVLLSHVHSLHGEGGAAALGAAQLCQHEEAQCCKLLWCGADTHLGLGAVVGGTQVGDGSCSSHSRAGLPRRLLLAWQSLSVTETQSVAAFPWRWALGGCRSSFLLQPYFLFYGYTFLFASWKYFQKFIGKFISKFIST